MNEQESKAIHKESELIYEGVEQIKAEVVNINEIANEIIDQLFYFKLEICQEELSNLILSRDYYSYKKYTRTLKELPWWKKVFKWQKKRLKNQIKKEIDEYCQPFIDHVKEEIRDLNHNHYLTKLKEGRIAPFANGMTETLMNEV